MPEELIVKHCSPTLAGLKTGNIIAFHGETEEGSRAFARYLNSILVPKGLRAMLFSRGQGRSELMYIYRPEKLEADLSDETAREILTGAGYPVDNTNHCVVRLLHRLREGKGFPHEIGLFLGYPSEDVKGFIENGAKCCKCCGYWKVYGDEDKVMKTFCRFEKCTRIYCRCWDQHRCIDRLVVPAGKKKREA